MIKSVDICLTCENLVDSLKCIKHNVSVQIDNVCDDHKIKEAFSKMSDWHLVIAGDLNTPHDEYKSMQNVTYLTPDDQENISKKLNHGEAVLLGMMIASELSNKKKLLSFKELSLIKKHYFNLKLFNNINKFFKKNEINKIVHFMKKDKKNVDEKLTESLNTNIDKVEEFLQKLKK